MAARGRPCIAMCHRIAVVLRRPTSSRRLVLSSARLLGGIHLPSEFNLPKRLYTGPTANSAAGMSFSLRTNMDSLTENTPDRTVGQGETTAVSEGEVVEDPFIQEQLRRYEMCRRWLAVIMGEDPGNFGEKDIREAIRYLMPSSLYAKDARPHLTHPYKLFARPQATAFDATGRPVAAAFYTGKAAYHDLIYDIYEQSAKLREANNKNTEYLNEQEEKGDDTPLTCITKGLPEKSDKSEPKRWIKKLELEKRLQEALTDKEFELIIYRLKKLASQPNAAPVRDFLDQFLFIIRMPGTKNVAQELDEQGRGHAMGYRKRAVAEAWVKHGAGQITVNDAPLVEYFGRIQDRKQIMFPFLVIDKVGKFDVICHVMGGGDTGQSGAIRLAISRALLNFSESYLEPLQEAGLLVRDDRIVERKKPGQKKARKKFAWVKR